MYNNSTRWNRTAARAFLQDEQGQGLTEYALIIILVAVITIVVMVLMGPQLNEFMNQIWWYFGY